MEFRNLKAQYEALKPAIDAGIREVINNSSFISGSQVEELERRLADYVGVKHCITCGNGTDALLMALMAWKIGEGDAVFVPDFTFFATGEVVSCMGATPVFVDVDEDTFNLDPASLEEAVKAVTAEGKLCPRAVIPVDLFGLPADYEQIGQIADKYQIKILEDAAQGFGGMIDNKRTCSFGSLAATSFFPAKPLGCYGDGGAVFVDDDETADYLKSIRIHGKGSSKYDNVRIGLNSRLDTIQAAVLLPKFQAFVEYELDRVNEAAQLYHSLLDSLVKIPTVPESYLSSWAQYTIQVKSDAERASLQKFLESNKIPSMVYYPKPMHRQDAFRDLKLYQPCPVSEKLCDTVLSLPMHPYLEQKSIEFVAEKIKEFYA